MRGIVDLHWRGHLEVQSKICPWFEEEKANYRVNFCVSCPFGIGRHSMMHNTMNLPSITPFHVADTPIDIVYL